MRPKLEYGLSKEFDPLDTYGQGFIEGKLMELQFVCSSDVPGLMGLLGGKQNGSYLDDLFNKELPDKSCTNRRHHSGWHHRKLCTWQ